MDTELTIHVDEALPRASDATAADADADARAHTDAGSTLYGSFAAAGEPVHEHPLSLGLDVHAAPHRRRRRRKGDEEEGEYEEDEDEDDEEYEEDDLGDGDVDRGGSVGRPGLLVQLDIDEHERNVAVESRKERLADDRPRPHRAAATHRLEREVRLCREAMRADNAGREA